MNQKQRQLHKYILSWDCFGMFEAVDQEVHFMALHSSNLIQDSCCWLFVCGFRGYKKKKTITRTSKWQAKSQLVNVECATQQKKLGESESCKSWMYETHFAARRTIWQLDCTKQNAHHNHLQNKTLLSSTSRLKKKKKDQKKSIHAAIAVTFHLWWGEIKK